MLRNIKSLFIMEDEETAKSQGTPPPKVVVPDTAPVISQSESGKPGKVSAKFSEVLIAAMERENPQGFDYMEFKQSLKSLASMPMDESTRYQSALAMAKTLGATPVTLLESAGHYLQVLKQEELKFEQALAKQQDEKIGQKATEQESLKTLINDKMETIKKLNLEIEKHKKELETLQKDMEEATHKVESTKNDFIVSYNSLVSQIQQDIDNLKKYQQ